MHMCTSSLIKIITIACLPFAVHVAESEDGGSLLGSSRKSLADTSVTSTADLSMFSGGQRSSQLAYDEDRHTINNSIHSNIMYDADETASGTAAAAAIISGGNNSGGGGAVGSSGGGQVVITADDTNNIPEEEDDDDEEASSPG